MRYQVPAVQARECLLRIVGFIEERFADISDNEQSDVYCFLTELQNLFGPDVGARHALPVLEQCLRE